MAKPVFLDSEHEELTMQLCQAKKALRLYLQRAFPVGAKCQISVGLSKEEAIVSSVEADETGGEVRLEIPLKKLDFNPKRLRAKPCNIKAEKY